MFDFMRKKKDVLPEVSHCHGTRQDPLAHGITFQQGHAQTVNKSKRSRRTSIMLPVGRAGSSKVWQFSGPNSSAALISSSEERAPNE